MTDEESLQELQDLIRGVVEAQTDDFSDLAKIAGLNPDEDFVGADLRGVNLRIADLRRANLSDADLRRANLSDADLSHANLSGVNLSHANLSGAILSDANLSGANLSGVFLIGAILSGAILSGAEVENARFGDNLGISQTMKLDLIRRGAIFEDSPGDRSGVLTRR